MNYAETARLLAAASSVDRRQLDDATVATWHAILGDLDAGDALEALRRHFAQSTDWLMPAHIRDGVRAIRDQRRAREEAQQRRSIAEARNGDPGRVQRAIEGMRAVRRAIADAPRSIAKAEEAPPTPSDQVRARAIARARAERGAGRAIEAPARDRRARNGPSVYTTAGVPEVTGIQTCARCRGGYADNPDGITAHRAVFGHSPATQDAA